MGPWLPEPLAGAAAEVVELAWANAAENYFNLQATALGFASEGLAARVPAA